MAPSRFTKVKIAIGYSLLLAILLFSLVFVHREMETLSASDDQQSLMTDSLLVLLREKDKNTIQMLRVLSEANDSLLSAREIEEIIAEQDSVVTQQRVQHRIITTRDSLITKPKKKGFFKRLAEAFVPSKQDTAVLVNTSLEVATDTILEAYHYHGYRCIQHSLDDNCAEDNHCLPWNQKQIEELSYLGTHYLLKVVLPYLP